MSNESIDAAETILEETLASGRSWLGCDYPIKPVEHLFFTEIYEIGLQEGMLERYPEVKDYLGVFPPEFIEFKYQEAASSPDFEKYKLAYFAALLKEDAVLRVRRSAIYLMYDALMRRDYGEFYMALGSDEMVDTSLTKEAEKYLADRESLARFNNDDQAEQYLLELKDLCASESVRQNILHHLMGLGVSPLSFSSVTRCVEIANKLSTLRGWPADNLLELAAQDKLEQMQIASK